LKYVVRVNETRLHVFRIGIGFGIIGT